MDTKKIEEIEHILDYDLNIGVPGTADLGDKIGLIAMICYLTDALQKKKPTLKHIDVINLCAKDEFSDTNTLQALALICEWFSNGCIKFPNLGIKAKDMPKLIKKQVMDLCPF